jgi:putative membrane protein
MTPELMSIAAARQYPVPRTLDVKDQADANILSILNGEEFDRAYLHSQHAAHICAVNQFEAEARHGRDPELKAWAERTVATLKSHRKQAREMCEKFEKKEHSSTSSASR